MKTKLMDYVHMQQSVMVFRYEFLVKELGDCYICFVEV